MTIIGGINLGNLTDYLFFFADGRTDANWQGATKGYVGDVAVDGIQADERTSGSVPYAGTIYTNDTTLGAWQSIINQNLVQATGVTNEVARISSLEADLISAIQQINALPASPGFTSVSSTSLNGLNTQNGINEIFVINITSGLSFSSKINITGDPGDVFILRWDTDGNPANGYQGQAKPSSGGAIVPLGGLTPANFINVAGDINASGGGTNPAPPYPQGPRYDDGLGDLIIGGSDFSGGGFFTGYWLTTGSPTTFDPVSGLYYGTTSSLSNGIFVGGWYTITTRFSMTSGTSGVYVSPNPATTAEPSIDIEKFVSVDGGVTWVDADDPPGPNLVAPMDPRFRFIVTNTGNETMTDIEVNDDFFGPITIPTTTLNPGESFEVIITGTWQAGQHVNEATVTGTFNNQQYTDSDMAHYFGTAASIDIQKLVSADGGTTWEDAEIPPGPFLDENTDPVFRFVVTNNGNVTLTDITLTDTVFGPITVPDTTLNPGEFFAVEITGTWQAGQNVNEATATGVHDNVTYTDTDLAHYFGATEPSIDIEKFVSVDGGLTWHDADTPPGPLLPPGNVPYFKFVVTNNGAAPLTDITVTDSVLGLIGTIESLFPGDSEEFIMPELP
jgi:hypothetical protein